MRKSPKVALLPGLVCSPPGNEDSENNRKKTPDLKHNRGSVQHAACNEEEGLFKVSIFTLYVRAAGMSRDVETGPYQFLANTFR